KMPSIRRLRRRLLGRRLHHQRNPRHGSKRSLDARERRDRGKCFGHPSRRELEHILRPAILRRLVETRHLQGNDAEMAPQQVVSPATAVLYTQGIEFSMNLTHSTPAQTSISGMLSG